MKNLWITDFNFRIHISTTYINTQTLHVWYICQSQQWQLLKHHHTAQRARNFLASALLEGCLSRCNGLGGLSTEKTLRFLVDSTHRIHGTVIFTYNDQIVGKIYHIMEPMGYDINCQLLGLFFVGSAMALTMTYAIWLSEMDWGSSSQVEHHTVGGHLMCPGFAARYGFKRQANGWCHDVWTSRTVLFFWAPCILSGHHNLWKIGHLHEFPLFDFVPRVHP